jgi:protein-histidine N-methyltransferase
VATAVGDLEIELAYLQNLKEDLCKRNIRISAISGAWGPEFVRLVNSEALPTSPSSSYSEVRQETLILASETIYSPSTINCFVSTLLALLATAEARGRTAKALVAAKKVYFGIGGGVNEFLAVLQEKGGQAKIVWELDGEGVDRVILEVTRFVA